MRDSRKELLDSYVQRARRKPVNGRMAEATALRNESMAMREIFAHAASDGKLDVAGLERDVLHGKFSGLDPEWVAKLARVRALQKFTTEDSAFALKALRWANRRIPQGSSTVRFRKLEVELLAEEGHFDEARDLIGADEDLQSLYHDYMTVDLKNPFVRREEDRLDEWLVGFNAPFRAQNMRPVELKGSAPKPFDRLSASPRYGPEPEGGPLVSVVLTVFKPDREALLLSAASILNQSWTHLELIVVDDASPDEYDEIVEELVNLDTRVRLIKLPVNGGTYLARNAGLEDARGKYVTGQDADDWSHPDRILTQVNYMEKNPHAPGVITYGIRTDENLQRIWRGQLPHRRCEVSLMMNSDTARATGGYLPARKGADSEFRERLGAYAGVEVATIEDPLYMIRVLQGSLSRSDFRAGWSHPNRRNFWDAYSYWHRKVLPAKLVTGENGVSPIPLPSGFQVTSPGPKTLDVVFAGDWRFDGSQQRQMLDEVELLLAEGWRVGLLQVESSLGWSNDNKSFFWEAAQELINSGKVTQLVFDEEAHVDLLILRGPTTMQFPTVRDCLIRFEKCVLVADEPSRDPVTEALNYLPGECAENVRTTFGVSPVWVPADSRVRQTLEGKVPHLAETDLPLCFLPDRWRTDRTRLRSQVPVVGRFGSSSAMGWPMGPVQVEALWPVGQDWDIRFLGDAQIPLKRVRHRRPPEGWTLFRSKDISPTVYLKSLDFYVHFGEFVEPATRRQLREAMAAGCVVICVGAPELGLGDGVLYARAEDVQERILEHIARPDLRRAQVGRAQVLAASCHSNSEYIEWFRHIIGAGSIVRSEATV